MNEPFVVGVFDSGSGGLTVVRELLRLRPDVHVLYLADTANLPYGDKSTDEIKRFAVRNVRFLESMGAGIIAVACNTSSSQAIHEMRQHARVSVLDIVSCGARLAASASSTGRIGVVATEGTVRSGAYAQQIKLIRQDACVQSVACPRLVPLIEGGAPEPEMDHWVETYLAEFTIEYDVLVLGCTHYPLISHVFRRYLPEGVQLVDPAKEIAFKVCQLLPEPNGTRWLRFFATGDSSGLKRRAAETLGLKVESVEKVEL
ncbi:MAG: glutamate racemase [Bacillota bacterium]